MKFCQVVYDPVREEWRYAFPTGEVIVAKTREDMEDALDWLDAQGRLPEDATENNSRN